MAFARVITGHFCYKSTMVNPADLPDDIELLKAIVLRQQDQNARLEKLVSDFKRALFGAKSEKIDSDQYELAFEDIETAIETIHAERDADIALRPAKPRKSNRGHLPKHLPRVEDVIDPDDIQCRCGAMRHMIGEDTSERLDIIPAQFRVIVTRRPKYACRSCETGIVQAPAKSRLIEDGMPTEATVASVIVSKYADHLPSIGKLKSMRGRVLIWIALHWHLGSEKPHTNCGLSVIACWKTSSNPPNCSWTRPPLRCWTQDEEKRKRVTSGRSPVMTGPGWEMRHPAWLSPTHRDVVANMQMIFCGVFLASFRSMVMRVIIAYSSVPARTCNWRIAGRMRDESFMTWPKPAPLRLHGRA